MFSENDIYHAFACELQNKLNFLCGISKDDYSTDKKSEDFLAGFLDNESDNDDEEPLNIELNLTKFNYTLDSKVRVELEVKNAMGWFDLHVKFGETKFLEHYYNHTNYYDFDTTVINLFEKIEKTTSIKLTGKFKIKTKECCVCNEQTEFKTDCGHYICVEDRKKLLPVLCEDCEDGDINQGDFCGDCTLDNKECGMVYCPMCRGNIGQYVSF